jgi:hypothetical protein
MTGRLSVKTRRQITLAFWRLHNMDVKFMQDLHTKEFTTRDALAQRATTIIAGITTLGGLAAFVVVNFKPTGHFIGLLFWPLTIASGIALLAAASYLIYSYRVPPLNDIANPRAWLDYWNSLKQEVTEGKLASAEAAFTDYLLNQYAEIGTPNIDANFKRGTRLVKSNNFMLASFALIVSTSIVFYYNNYIVRDVDQGKGVKNMLTDANALVCIPAAQMSDMNADSVTRPRPRPVPAPLPPPNPDKP